MTRGEQNIRLRGQNVAYSELGQENFPAIVCIHGWASSRRMWTTTQEHYSNAYRVIALDLPGHGASDKPALDWYSIANFSEIVAALCLKLELEAPILIGHSMGGKIALKTSAILQTRINRMVLINPAINNLPARNSLGLREGLYSLSFGISRLFWPFATRLIERPPDVIQNRRPLHVIRNRADLARTTAESAFGSIRAVMQEDITQELARCEVPVLVLVGLNDETIAPSEGRAAAGSLSNSNLVEIADGHHLLDEAPQETFSAIDVFLGADKGAG